MHQLDIGYPDSPLSKELPERSGGLRAGDRAPDAPVRRAGGQLSRLFELFRGPHWTLLVNEAPHANVSPRPELHIHHIGREGDVIDAEGHVRDAYALIPGECALIRPDGYVGAIVDVAVTTKLELYFTRMSLVQLEHISK
ncbi:hypothetical protein D3C72_1642060 [compost metagenome]